MEFPLNFGLNKTGLLLILTSGKLKNLCFLIDTGSTYNLIFKFVYDHFKNEFELLEEVRKTMGIEGNYVESNTVQATLNFEGEEYPTTFTLIDNSTASAQIQEETGVQIHGILGIDFLIKYGWTIDFQNCTIKSNCRV